MRTRIRSLRVEAVVLSHRDWNEADRLLALFTRQMGKVRAIAKGVRMGKSRKAGHLEPFTHVSLQLGFGHDIFIINQAETINAYLSLREDLLRVGYASYVIELLDRFTYDGDENRSLYLLLTNTLDRIDKESNPLVALRYYEMRLLDLLGYRPQLFSCLGCESEIEPVDQYFSFSQGGVLCPNCGVSVSDARPISMTVLKYLRHFQRSSYAEATRARLTSELNRQLEQFAYAYLTYLLERGLNTPTFLRHVRDEGQS